tara:strand:- start:297 stop:716 length:420 start_codon:yes stop_codon:yes gene_type:complete
MYEKNDWIIIVGCTINENKDRKKPQFTVAKVLFVGQDDLIVKPERSFSNSALFVSKKSCRKIPVQDIDVTNILRGATIGDLVLFYHEKWNGEVESALGYLLEIKYNPGSCTEGLLLTDGEQKWYDFNKLLVLDLNSAAT